VAEGKYEDQIAALQVQITQLQRENQKLQTAFTEVAHANVLPTVLSNGFADVIAELRPLRDLTPQRASVPRPVANALLAVLDAMEGVKLLGGSLGIPEVHVPFIGQPRLQASASTGSGAPLLPAPGEPNPYPGQGTLNQSPLGGGYRP
jgi:hypothetical protein